MLFTGYSHLSSSSALRSLSAENQQVIGRIEVHNNDKFDTLCHVKVDIYFSVIGMMYIPDEKGIRAMIDEVQKYRSVA